jgi:hypothetical protein
VRNEEQRREEKKRRRREERKKEGMRETNPLLSEGTENKGGFNEGLIILVITVFFFSF